MLYNPVGVGEIELTTIILDLNGTLAVNGGIVSGVAERIQKLKAMGFTIHLFTGDLKFLEQDNDGGGSSHLATQLGIQVQKATTTAEKEALTMKLDVEKTVAIGNARIDIGTFRPCKVRIGTLQAEGIHAGILAHIDILVPSITDAFDLLINESTFNATMRK